MEEAGEVSGAGGKWRPEEGEAVVVREEGATGGGGGAAPSLVGSPKAGKEGQSPGLLWRRWGGGRRRRGGGRGRARGDRPLAGLPLVLWRALSAPFRFHWGS